MKALCNLPLTSSDTACEPRILEEGQEISKRPQTTLNSCQGAGISSFAGITFVTEAAEFEYCYEATASESAWMGSECHLKD